MANAIGVLLKIRTINVMGEMVIVDQTFSITTLTKPVVVNVKGSFAISVKVGRLMPVDVSIVEVLETLSMTMEDGIITKMTRDPGSEKFSVPIIGTVATMLLPIVTLPKTR